jgi:exonuclease SbcC
MIDTLIIEGFQSHHETAMELHPGLNVIVGPSDQGKSSIVRALRWVCRNRPQGESFINDELGKTAVTIECDGFLVTRERNKKKNCYHIEGEELKALRSDVPEEVSNVLQVYDQNIQSQHPNDQYFLLSDSPGQIAKKFNEVSNMAVMDNALKSVNSKVRKTNQTIRHIEEEIQESKDALKSMLWIGKAHKHCERLLDREEMIAEKSDRFDMVTELLQDIYDIEEQLADRRLLQDATKALGNIESDLSDLTEEKNSFESLSETLTFIGELETALDTYQHIDEALNALNSLENRFTEYTELDHSYYNTKDLVTEMINLQEQISVVGEAVEEAEETLHSVLGDSVCPLCGREP